MEIFLISKRMLCKLAEKPAQREQLFCCDQNSCKEDAMTQNEQIGAKMKACRQEKGLTLKQLSDMVDLSVGFLSQAERGLATISLNSLYRLATALEVDVSFFFNAPSNAEKDQFVVRGYERNCLRVTPDFVYYALCPDPKHSEIFPEIYELLPGLGAEGETYQNQQEEYLYVIEGVLTAWLDDCEYQLYPGDTMWIPSNHKHKWQNNTPHIVKLLSVGIRLESSKK